MPTSLKEIRGANEKRGDLLQELKDALGKMQGNTPGQPCIEIPLDKVFTYRGDGGEPKGLIEVQQVIYLVDEVLRR